MSSSESEAHPDHDPHQPLTPREREVFDLLLDALSNRQIARRLGVTEETAKFHVSNILRKSQVTSRAELLAEAARNAPRSAQEATRHAAR